MIWIGGTEGGIVEVDAAQSNSALHYEKRAGAWNRWITLMIVGLLLLPFPFVRFETWPGGGIISQRLIMPWSRFRVCYVSVLGGEPVEERYAFTWKGKVVPEDFSPGSAFPLSSAAPPLLKWQDGPEIVLKDVFYRGDLFLVKTLWRPLIIWPLELGWRMVPRDSSRPAR